MRAACEPVLVGEASVWKRAGRRPGDAPVVDTNLGLKLTVFGRSTREGGAASFAAFEKAVALAARGQAAGVVTAPISKRSWDLAGVAWRDHTEFLRARFPEADAQMILGAPGRNLWCILATRHMPLKDAPRRLSASAILACAATLRAALRRLGRGNPRLGLCALNPHGGEEGLLGDEEKALLAPAARRAGLLGPIPADTAWRHHREGLLDGLVCLYHDQALIPLKVAAGLEIVNWTTGLPFVRTSPGHGTGFDIAGRRPADPAATIEAALLAARLARNP